MITYSLKKAADVHQRHGSLNFMGIRHHVSQKLTDNLLVNIIHRFIGCSNFNSRIGGSLST